MGKERYQGPRREVFVVRKEKQRDLLNYFKQDCRSLYGSDIRVDKDGNILYQTWPEIKREKVVPDKVDLLSKKRQRPDVYLRQRLVTKKPHESRINVITEDEGGVEAGIRSMEHILTGERGKETQQVRTIKQRVVDLLDFFRGKDLFQKIPDEEYKRLEAETIRRLNKVKLDPDTVFSEEKEKMTRWLMKASGGKDSLGRENPLITNMALLAAQRRAIEREKGIGHIIPKFLRNREALIFEREFSRGIIEEVKEQLEPQRMPGHYLFKHPDKPPQQAGLIKGMLDHMSWQLEQPHVKPYKPAGLRAGEVLGEIRELVEQNRRREAKDLFGQAREILEEVLDRHKEIYPK